MKMSITTTHVINFTVEYHSDVDGGMETEQYGGLCSTLESAVSLLMQARAAKPNENWVIVADVTTTVGQGPKAPP